MAATKPPVVLRLLIVAGLAGLAALDHNPIVRFEAWLGLSPSPLERLFGIRGFFSGMTEAAFRLTRFDLAGAAQANPLVFPVIGAFGTAILLWQWPKLRTPRQEYGFLALIVAGTAVNNAVPFLLQR